MPVDDNLSGSSGFSSSLFGSASKSARFELVFHMVVIDRLILYVPELLLF